VDIELFKTTLPSPKILFENLPMTGVTPARGVMLAEYFEKLPHRIRNLKSYRRCSSTINGFLDTPGRGSWSFGPNPKFLGFFIEGFPYLFG